MNGVVARADGCQGEGGGADQGALCSCMAWLQLQLLR
jgi:hypothetical protein